ncbi:MAG TPA: glycosyltransferase [Chthoniobacterales bacterium]|nr:glycosyltransferase [Chthoniobacterales bacterium]
MKILQLLPTLDPRAGGVAAAVLSLSREIARRGHDVDIVVLDDASSPWLADVDLPVHALGLGAGVYRYSKKLLPWLRENGGKYHRVMVNGTWQYPGFAAWRRFAGSGTPYYVFPHGMLDPWFKRTYPLKHLKKWLYWPWAEYRILRDAAAVIFTSEQERDEARESFWLYRCLERVSPLGVEPPPALTDSIKGMFTEKFPELRDRRLFLFLGRLHPKKGCDIAIESLARASGAEDFSLVLAGPDQIGLRNQLEALAAREGIASRVIFCGMLEGDLKRSALANAEAFLLPSHQENFGIAVVEALAEGLPVLISNRINIWREIEKDRAGYAANDDVDGTTNLLERWTKFSTQERETMRSNARRCFTERFEIGRAVDSLLNILSGGASSQ